MNDEDASRAAIRRDFEREQYERADQQVPPLMTPDEAAKTIQGKIEHLERCVGIYSSPQWKADVLKEIALPTDAVRALLAGYTQAMRDLAIFRECANCTIDEPACPYTDGSIWNTIQCTRNWRGPGPGGEESQ